MRAVHHGEVAAQFSRTADRAAAAEPAAVEVGDWPRGAEHLVDGAAPTGLRGYGKVQRDLLPDPAELAASLARPRGAGTRRHVSSESWDDRLRRELRDERS